MVVRFFLALSLILALALPGSAAATTGVSQCAKPTTTTAGCFARVVSARPAAAPSGLSPAALRSAYGAAGGGSAKIAVVDAYGDPGIKADLDTYSRVFGLPVMPACGSAAQTGCFEKTNQTGGTSFPRSNAGWAVETALDVEVAHGVCPSCRIELIEATSASITNLTAAVDQAVRSGAQVVSMSWGGNESSAETAKDSHFAPNNVAFVASSGDSGYGTSWPAVSPNVLAVGGTHLTLNASGGRSSETAWSGSGSGCSKYEPKPTWQHDTACAHRSMADISAVADPATGAAVYSTLSDQGSGWFTVGGTSLAAPVIAGLVGLTGVQPHAAMMSRLYGSLGGPALYDVISGSTGPCATYLCRATAGYDGPTGVGAPKGLSAL